MVVAIVNASGVTAVAVAVAFVVASATGLAVSHDGIFELDALDGHLRRLLWRVPLLRGRLLRRVASRRLLHRGTLLLLRRGAVRLGSMRGHLHHRVPGKRLHQTVAREHVSTRTRQAGWRRAGVSTVKTRRHG